MDESILIKYLQGKCTEAESVEVETWCEMGTNNRKIVEELYRTLFVGQCVAVMNATDTEAALTRFKSRVKEKKQSIKHKTNIARRLRYAAVAAAFFTGVIVTGMATHTLLSDKLADYEVMTAAGQRVQAILPDGSRVWLNASSHLVYHHSFWSSDRRVDLSGEAYFEVRPNRSAPFIVRTKQVSTRVLGTKFNVRAREEEERVITTLLQGLVRVDSPRTEGNGYYLKPGQTLNINTHTYQLELIEYQHPTDILLWIGGTLSFKQHSLLEITDIMEKLYDIHFAYEDESLKTEHFTGEFSTDSTPDEILNVLMHTNHFSYTKEGRVVRIMKR